MSEYIEKEFYCKTSCHCVAEYCDKSKCPVWNAPAADVAPALRCLDAFERDHNLEHLLDAANYLMYRFSFPLPGDYFQATDSSGSVGTVGTPINMERGDFG